MARAHTYRYARQLSLPWHAAGQMSGTLAGTRGNGPLTGLAPEEANGEIAVADPRCPASRRVTKG